jgi:sugar lactone lactonase YvrE
MRNFTWILFLSTIVHGHAAEVADAGAFADGSAWETVGENYHVVEGIAATGDGTVYLTDVLDDELFKVVAGQKEELLDSKTSRANGLALGPGGMLYSVCMSEPKALVWNLQTGERTEIPLVSPGNDLVIVHNKWLYWTWGPQNSVYLLDLETRQSRKVAEVKNGNGITVSPDGKELWVGEFTTDTVQSLAISTNGDLGPARATFKVKLPENGKGLIDGMTPLADGRLLVATALGLQVLASDGTAQLISNPTDQRANYVRLVTDASGGRWIYAAYVKSVLRRRTVW